MFVIPLDFGANCYMDATTAEIRRGGGLLASEVGAMLQQLESDAVSAWKCCLMCCVVCAISCTTTCCG